MNLFNRIFRRGALDTDVREELESHIAMRAELNRKAGMSEDDALHEARVQFGNSASIREDIYGFNGFAILDALWRDVRTGLRTLRRYPGVTAMALLSLTLGIGANTLAFSFVNALLFRSLPYPKADRLVIPDDPLTPDECRSLRERGRDIFEDVGCFVDERPAGQSFSADGDSVQPVFVLGHRFTPSLGRVLGVQPQLGRWFSDDDNAAVVISHRFWLSRFSGGSHVVGKRVRIDGSTVTIVGVMPDEFEFLVFNVDYWAPVAASELVARRDSRVLGAVARLAPGATLAQAQSVLDALMAIRVVTVEERNSNKRVRFSTMNDFARGQLTDFALVFQGTVLFVLLIACANVAGLLLTQAVSLQGQLAVRTALGAGTWRIARQVLVHSVLLFSVGGICGLAAGWAGVRLMVNVVFPFAVDAYGEPRGGIPRGILEAGLDSNVFLFTFSLSVICGLVASLVPMLQVARAQPLVGLRESTQNSASGLSRQRLRSVFVSAQVALALILLVGATLMIRGMRETLNQDIGFEPKDLLTVRLRLPNTDKQRHWVSELMRENLAGIAGITSATGIAISPPLSGAVSMPVELVGMPSQGERAQFLPILTGYFETLHVKVVQGKEFGPTDTVQSEPVAVVNEAAARRYWPNQNPLGKQIRFQSTQIPLEPPRTVIGVVTEVSQYSRQSSRSQIYVPYSQVHVVADPQLGNQLRDMTFIVRTPRPLIELAGAIGKAIVEVDRSQAVSVHTVQQTMFASTQRRGIMVAVFALFGVIAVVLAVIGVYGVMSNLVSQRFNELGIRIAIGAGPRQIRSLVLRRGSFLIGVGLLVGMVLSLALARVIRSLLFGSSPNDPIAFGLGVVLLGAAAFVACYLPAHRASRIDPIVALRHH